MRATETLLRDALSNLAADPDEQERYLRALGTWPSLDELALSLDDVAEASKVWASPALCDAIDALSALTAQMSGERNAWLWEPEALGGQEWAEVRVLAREALALLDAEM